MNKFPAFLDLRSLKTVLIGGGEAAAAKARLLAAAGADLLVIWPEIARSLEEAVADKATLARRSVSADDFHGAKLVFIAVDDEEDAAAYAALARVKGALVNVVDAPALCDFNVPSIVDRGEVTVAISTDGAAPVLGRRLRTQIEAAAPARLGALARFAKQYRASVKASRPAGEIRAFWERFFDGPVAADVLAGNEQRAHESMLALINRPDTEQKKGAVHIVGAGPGDPDLLTLKALRLLQSADVIFYDRLVSDEILGMARRDAERFYVGKRKSDHAVPQEEIERRMVERARAGDVVVRLKGGDPFVFGRGGEELEAMRAAGVEAFVTPGITAATGCAAAAGMALTHRDHAQAVTFVTGHGADDRDPEIDWSTLAKLGHTLVVYMGVAKAPVIAAHLIKHGRSPMTPAAVIENGTRADQVIAKGALHELPAIVDRIGVKGPALLVIGEVAALAEGDLLQSTQQQIGALAQTERLSA